MHNRIIAIILALLTLFSLFSFFSCDKTDNDSNDETTQGNIISNEKMIYKFEYINPELSGKGESTYDYCTTLDNRLAFRLYFATPAEEPNQNYFVIYDADKNEFVTKNFFLDVKSEEDYSYFFSSFVEAVDGSCYALGDKDKIFITIDEAEQLSSKPHQLLFMKYDAEGNCVYAIPTEEIDSRINMYTTFCVDADNNIYFFIGHNYDELILVYSDGLEYLFSIENFIGKSVFNGTYLFSDENGNVYFCYTDRTGGIESEIRFCRIDPEIKGLRDYKEMPEIDCNMGKDLVNTRMTQGLIGGGKYDAYSYDYNSLYGNNLDEEPVKLFDWLQFGLETTMIKEIYVHSENEIFLVLHRPEEEIRDITDRKYDYALIHTVPISSVYGEGAEEEVILKLAVDSESNRSYTRILECAASFIRNSGCRVEIVSYSDTEGGFSANQKLLRDISAGDAPDVVAFGGGLTYERLMSIGAFVDLYGLIDSDPEISRSDFLPCVLTPFENQQGELFQLVNEFALTTMIAKKSTAQQSFGGGLPTFEQLMKLNDSLGGEQYLFDVKRASSPSDAAYKLLEGMLPQLLGDFIDYENKTCDFGRLDELLELCRKAKLSSVELFSPPVMTTEGDLKILRKTYSGFSFYMYDRYMCFPDDIEYVGYPKASGSGMSVMPASTFSITSQSGHHELAWKLIRHFIKIKENDLKDTFEISYDQYYPCTYRGMEIAFETIDKCVFEMGGNYYRSPGSSAESFSPIMACNKEYEDMKADPTRKFIKMSQSDKDALMSLIENADSVCVSDSIALSIILEEAAYYFSGTKSLDETVKVIQNRIETKIWE